MASGKRQAQGGLELRLKTTVCSAAYGDFPMAPAYFVIAILGCADGGSACTPVATLQTHYSTEAQCSAAAAAALEKNSNFDFPSLLARCRPGALQKAAAAQHDKAQPVRVRRA